MAPFGDRPLLPWRWFRAALMRPISKWFLHALYISRHSARLPHGSFRWATFYRWRRHGDMMGIWSRFIIIVPPSLPRDAADFGRSSTSIKYFARFNADLVANEMSASYHTLRRDYIAWYGRGLRSIEPDWVDCHRHDVSTRRLHSRFLCRLRKLATGITAM